MLEVSCKCSNLSQLHTVPPRDPTQLDRTQRVGRSVRDGASVKVQSCILCCTTGALTSRREDSLSSCGSGMCVPAPSTSHTAASWKCETSDCAKLTNHLGKTTKLVVLRARADADRKCCSRPTTQSGHHDLAQPPMAAIVVAKKQTILLPPYQSCTSMQHRRFPYLPRRPRD